MKNQKQFMLFFILISLSSFFGCIDDLDKELSKMENQNSFRLAKGRDFSVHADGKYIHWFKDIGYDANRGANEPVANEYEGERYFVSTTGNDSNAGTETAPWATLDHADTEVQPGDIVYIRGGVYDVSLPPFNGYEKITTSGTVDSPITYKSYPGETAIFTRTDGDTQAILRLVDCYYVNIENIHFNENKDGPGIYLQGVHHVNIENVLSDYHKGRGFEVYSSWHTNFKYCTAHNNENGNSADGFTINLGEYNTFKYCLSSYSGDDGFDTWASKYDTLEHCVSYKSGYHLTPAGQEIEVQGGNGQGFKLHGHNVPENISGGGDLVRNSLAIFNKSNGFDAGGGNITTFIASTLINNTTYGNGHFGYNLLNADHLTFNNLSFNDKGGEPEGDLNPNSTLDPLSNHNSWELAPMVNANDFISTDFPFSMQSQHGEPNFVQYILKETEFLHIPNNSQLLDAGTNLGYPYMGYEPDIGHFERAYENFQFN